MVKHHHHNLDRDLRALIDHYSLLNCEGTHELHRQVYGDACFCAYPESSHGLETETQTGRRTARSTQI